MRWIFAASTIAAVAAVTLTSAAPPQTIIPDETTLRMFPKETSGVAFIDLAALRSAPLYDEAIVAQFKTKLPPDLKEFEEATGIVLDRDLVSLTLGRVGAKEMVAVVRASFDGGKVEQYLTDKQVQTEDYAGRVIFHPRSDSGVIFVDNMVIAGHTESLKNVVDRLAVPSESVLDNPGLLDSIKTIQAGSQVWAAGAFDTRLLPAQPPAPAQVAELIQSLRGGTYQMRVDQDIHVIATARFSDSAKARMSADLLRGLLAVAKLQLSQRPDLTGLLDGVQVHEDGLSMKLNVDISGVLLKELQNLKRPAADD